MGDRLATKETGRKWGAVTLLGGQLRRHLTQCGRAEAYLRKNWHLGPSCPLATIDMGRKLGVGRNRRGPKIG